MKPLRFCSVPLVFVAIELWSATRTARCDYVLDRVVPLPHSKKNSCQSIVALRVVVVVDDDDDVGGNDDDDDDDDDYDRMLMFVVHDHVCNHDSSGNGSDGPES